MISSGYIIFNQKIDKKDEIIKLKNKVKDIDKDKTYSIVITLINNPIELRLKDNQYVFIYPLTKIEVEDEFYQFLMSYFEKRKGIPYFTYTIELEDGSLLNFVLVNYHIQGSILSALKF